jgi:hypothetical protein
MRTSLFIMAIVTVVLQAAPIRNQKAVTMGPIHPVRPNLALGPISPVKPAPLV